jgi:hypothetical protein
LNWSGPFFLMIGTLNMYMHIPIPYKHKCIIIRVGQSHVCRCMVNLQYFWQGNHQLHGRKSVYMRFWQPLNLRFNLIAIGLAQWDYANPGKSSETLL